jgi:hypothetical protein
MTSELMELLGTPPAAYQKLRNPLEGLGWICQGTVVCRPLRRRVKGRWVEKGPYYLWTGKSGGKTICHALSKEQYQAAQKAIAANRHALKALAQMQAMTLEKILEKLPGVRKRKCL